MVVNEKSDFCDEIVTILERKSLAYDIGMAYL